MCGGGQKANPCNAVMRWSGGRAAGVRECRRSEVIIIFTLMPPSPLRPTLSSTPRSQPTINYRCLLEKANIQRPRSTQHKEA